VGFFLSPFLSPMVPLAPLPDSPFAPLPDMVAQQQRREGGQVGRQEGLKTWTGGRAF
jgi:hypothetical protein